MSQVGYPTTNIALSSKAAQACQPRAGEFAGLYRLRVKDYRAIYARTTDGYLVLRIAHRREAYSGGRP